MFIQLDEFIDNLGEGLVAYFVTNEGKVYDIITDGNDFSEIEVEVPFEPSNEQLGDYFIGVYEINSDFYQIFVTNVGLERNDQAL